MSMEEEQLIQVFKELMEAVLINDDPEKAISLFADDVIGIGMGSQGIVTGKEDAARITRNGKMDTDKVSAEIDYLSLQVRCYEKRYGTVCGVVRIKTKTDKKTVESTLGQIMNFRKEGQQWLVYALEATPLFEEIEEMEAYPIKFAETVLETYRQQEQIVKNAQDDSIGLYFIDVTKGIFENARLKSDLLVKVEKGAPYEQVIFQNARKHLNEEENYQFISMFSLGNILNAYQKGQTELSLQYKRFLSKHDYVWLKTVLKLYKDKTDESLKGYLYVFDIDKEKRKELMLQSEVELDSLTQLYNRRYAEKKIAEKLNEVSLSDLGAFFMIDLDYFKNINDTYGHQEGDRVIMEMAHNMMALTGPNDVAGRIGGDEFCIYFQGNLTVEEMTEKAKILCDTTRNIMPSKKTGTTCSIGIAFCSEPGLTFEEVYFRADWALYQQKKSGRDGYTVYDGSKGRQGSSLK